MLVLRDHISRCRECRDEHYSLKTMKYLLSALPEKEPRAEWVAYLAESFVKPTPTAGSRLRGQWERALDSWTSFFARSTRGGVPIKTPRLALVLTVSAVGVFAVVAPFDRPGTAPTAGIAPAQDSRASVMSLPPGLVSTSSLSAERPLPPGATEFVVEPLGPPPAKASAPILLPQPMIQPTAPGDLSQVNFQQLGPQATSFNNLGSIPASRPSAQTLGH